MTAIRFGLFSVLLILSACNQPIVTNGKWLTDSELEELKVGMTKEELREEIGSPSYISALDDDFWAYIGTKSQVRVFQHPEALERRIIALEFFNDRLRDVVQLTLKDGKVIYPNKDRTPTNGRTISIVEEMLGNIGRF